MSFKSRIALILSVFVILTKQEGYSKTIISVYYETFCDECEQFLTKQLYPTFLDVGNYVKVQFIPFGNTTRITLPDGTWSYSCTNGAKQCVGNKVLACAENGLNDSEKQKMCYMSCIMFNPYDGPQCASKFDADDNAVAACVNSIEGDVLLARHEQMTGALEASLTDLPIVTFDGVYNASEQILARTNLLKLLCDEYFKHSPFKKSISYSYSYSSSSSSAYYFPPACEEHRASDTVLHKNYKSNYFYPYNERNCKT